jgi:hypothetical protein
MIVGADGGAMLIGGAGIELALNQTGNGNIITGSVISGTGSISVTQVGDWNNATIVQQ